MPKKLTAKNQKTSKLIKAQTKKSSQHKTTKPAVIKRRYWETLGRRKHAIARVRLYTTKLMPREDGDLLVNGKPYKEYFPGLFLQKTVEAGLTKLKSLNRFKATIKVKGGGLTGQAEAIRHGLARALVSFNPDFRKKLKRAGFLRRDPRMTERKKYGLKKARRGPQWSKR